MDLSRHIGTQHQVVFALDIEAAQTRSPSLGVSIHIHHFRTSVIIHFWMFVGRIKRITGEHSRRRHRVLFRFFRVVIRSAFLAPGAGATSKPFTLIVVHRICGSRCAFPVNHHIQLRLQGRNFILGART